MEEVGVEGGGAPDGEVGATAEAPRPLAHLQERRDERQAQVLSCDADVRVRPESSRPVGFRAAATGDKLADATTRLESARRNEMGARV